MGVTGTSLEVDLISVKCIGNIDHCKNTHVILPILHIAKQTLWWRGHLSRPPAHPPSLNLYPHSFQSSLQLDMFDDGLDEPELL